jgi:predicted PurR-regulated permease PerM
VAAARVAGDEELMMEQPTETGPRWAMPPELRILFGLGMTVLVIFGARAGGSVLMPVFAALVLAITVHPVYGACARRGWPRWVVGVSATLVAAYGVVLALAVAVVVAVATFATLLPHYKSDMNDLVDSAATKLKDPSASGLTS